MEHFGLGHVFVFEEGVGLPVVGEGAAACHLELFKRGWVFSDRASTDEQFLGVHLADGWVQRLQKMLAEDELKDAVLLVLANKQDMGVMSVSEVVEKLGLHTLRGREWNIQGTCALTGDGLHEGFTWLSKATSKKS